uniref:Uncharacterized protein n=1 Tax=Cannabis sativa TaxID=3483 RepID=A0A803PMC5_CANSA
MHPSTPKPDPHGSPIAHQPQTVTGAQPTELKKPQPQPQLSLSSLSGKKKTQVVRWGPTNRTHGPTIHHLSFFFQLERLRERVPDHGSRWVPHRTHGPTIAPLEFFFQLGETKRGVWGLESGFSSGFSGLASYDSLGLGLAWVAFSGSPL